MVEQKQIGLLRGVGLSFLVSGLGGFVGLAAVLTVLAKLSGILTGREFFIFGRQMLSNGGMLVTLGSVFIILFLSLLVYIGPKIALFTPAVTCTFDATIGFLIIEQQRFIRLSRITKYAFTEIAGIGVEAASGYDFGDNHDIFLVLRSSQKRVPILRYSSSREAQRVSQSIAAFINVTYYGLV